MKENVIQQWNQAAQAYMNDQEKSDFVQSNKKIVQDRFQDLSGKTVLDLGCGYGWYTEYFRQIGAKAVGCDGAAKMIELSKAQYPKCQFDVVDAEKAFPYENDTFDLVFCNQVLMDLENIDNLLTEVQRVLKPGGTFYMAIVHPAFYHCEWGKDETGFKKAKIMETYLTHHSFDNDFWGSTRHYHRTVSWYLNTIISHGFQLVWMGEPEAYDGITKTKEFPLFMFGEFIKQ